MSFTKPGREIRILRCTMFMTLFKEPTPNYVFELHFIRYLFHVDQCIPFHFSASILLSAKLNFQVDFLEFQPYNAFTNSHSINCGALIIFTLDWMQWFQFQHKIRQRDWVAILLPVHWWQCEVTYGLVDTNYASQWGSLRCLQCTSWPCLWRWSKAHWQTLLHQQVPFLSPTWDLLTLE